METRQYKPETLAKEKPSEGQLKSLAISQCRLRLSRALRKGEATAIRGFFGRQFEDQVYMHNHQSDGTPIYLYPRVQYKIVDQTALLYGINEGSELLQKLWLDFDQSIPLADHDQSLTVLETQFETANFEIRHSVDPIEYKFATPWLALNQKNFGEYTNTRNQKLRREKLERTLVGNCLGMCKSLGIPRFSDHERITADCRGLTSIKTSLKGKGMIGFVGKFSLTLELPDYIGLGKSVSRGFGTIERT